MKKITFLIFLVALSIGHAQEFPLNFTNPNQLFTGVGGATTSIVPDPTASTNQVLRVVGNGENYDTAQLNLLTNYINLADNANNTITFRVRPEADYGTRTHLLKFESQGPGGGAASTELQFTTSGTSWTNVTLDFPAGLGNYKLMVLFPDFGNALVGTYLFDDFSGGTNIAPPPPPLMSLLLGFETNESGGVNGAPFGGMAAPVLENGTGTNTSQVLKIVGNTATDVWQGINLNLTSLVNLTNSKTMTMDVLSANPITFLVKVTNGVGGPAVVAASATHTGGNTWQTLTFTFDTSLDGQAALANGIYSGFVIHTYWAAGATSFTTVTKSPRTFYVDNIRGPLGTAPVIPAPTVPAPTPPNRPVNDVKSIYSNVYTPITTFSYGGDLNSYNTSWCPSVTTEFLIGGDASTASNRITGLGSGLVAGTSTTSPPYIGSDLNGGCEGINFRAGSFDATSFTHFHIDIWTPIQTMALRNISLKLSNHNPTTNIEVNAIERNITNATPLPNQLPSTNPNPGTWLSFDIPLADFTVAGGGSNARNNIAEFIISTNLGTVYYDNAYFHKNTILSSDSFAVSKVKLYPNPTSNVLNIESVGTIQNISIFNVLGQEVMNKLTDEALVSLDVSGLNAGIYVIKTVVDGVVSSTKFIKE